MSLEAEPIARAVLPPRGRPRSESSHRAILDAFRDLLIEVGFARLRLEHVAARAGASKATVYRRWRSKEELAGELVRELGTPHVAVADLGDARQELVSVAADVIWHLTESDFGPVFRRLLCEIAGNPAVGEPFRATVIQARREEVRRVIERGIARGELRTTADPDLAAELLVGSIYAHGLFGGVLDDEYAETLVDSLLTGYAAAGPGGGFAAPAQL
jgi:AcrR family transcriptional regulator